MATATATAATHRVKISPRCSKSRSTQAATRRKAPSSRAPSSASRRTSPSSTSAPRPKGAWRCANSPAPGRPNELKVGDTVEVYLERVENALGEAVLSRDKARREESWGKLEKAFKNNEKVSGVIFNQVKGGFTVDLDGAVAFLPRSQVDIRPIRDVGPLMNQPQPFQILKMDRRRGNIVVSRRTVLEETRAEQRQELVQNLEEGQVIDGVVKNITDYGAFVDLGGIDGLLHVTDIAWRRVNHPTEVLNIGQQVKVKIIKINHETHRISLGMKQLQDDPWQGIEAKYPVGARFKGRVTNITDYGAFVELEPGIEGLIHVSEMSWTKKNVHPGKIVSTSQEVEVQILEVDPVKRRISLGLKQTMRNPWEVFVEKYPAGTRGRGRGQEQDRVRPVPRPRRRRRRHGAPLRPRLEAAGRAGDRGVQEGRQGQGAGARRRRREGAHLARHQAARRRPVRGDEAAGDIKKGAVVTCEVTEVKEAGLDVKIVGTDLTTFIKRSELARDRGEQRPERFAVGQKVDAPRDPVRPPRPQGRRSRSRRSKSPRRRRRSPNTAPPIPAPRSATSSVARCGDAMRNPRRTTNEVLATLAIVASHERPFPGALHHSGKG